MATFGTFWHSPPEPTVTVAVALPFAGRTFGVAPAANGIGREHDGAGVPVTAHAGNVNPQVTIKASAARRATTARRWTTRRGSRVSGSSPTSAGVSGRLGTQPLSRAPRPA